MLLTLVGIGLPVIGIAGLIVGIKKGNKRIWITSLLVPLIYWIAYFVLLEADRRYIERETEKNGGVTPDWVW